MDDAAASKRRRGLGVVTPNACTECRKKRVKCDGQTPCGRCLSQKTNCIYELPVRQSKENMRHEIEELRNQHHQTERLLAALVDRDTSGIALESLRAGAPIDVVLDKLDIAVEDLGKGKANESSLTANVTTYSDNRITPGLEGALRGARKTGQAYNPTSAVEDVGNAFSLHTNSVSGISARPARPAWGDVSDTGLIHQPELSISNDAMQWSPNTAAEYIDKDVQDPGSTQVGRWYPHFEGAVDAQTASLREEGIRTILGQPFGSQDPGVDNCQVSGWTSITNDHVLIEHLLALYFCWEYPTFASLSKEHFLDDLQSGRRRNCSTLLVNAMLAVGCRYSTLGSTRTDPDNSNTSGDHFFAEALRLLNGLDNKHELTTVQALGLMSIREASAGRFSMALYYSGQSIRLAVEMGLHLEHQRAHDHDADKTLMEITVKSATFWGAFALDQCWCLSTGQIPAFSQDTKITPPPSIVDIIEASPWIPYTDDGAPLERNCTQPSNERTVYKTFCELSVIVHDSIYLSYSPGTKLTAKGLLGIYSRYLNWYDAIPCALRLGQNFTPAVLFCHMYYHFSILLLFRPFVRLAMVGSSVLPRDVCSQAADAISALVHSYDQLYTLRRAPSFVPSFIVGSSITHLLSHGDGSRGMESFNQAIADLKVMESCHGFATRSCEILQFLAADWEISVDWAEDEERKGYATTDAHDKRDTSRPTSKADARTLCRPRRESLNMYCPNIEKIGAKQCFNQGDADRLEEDQDLLVALFAPFPLQGRPLLGDLQTAGFTMLNTNE
ncbi:fungal-specific transcription factor domain-containing protein [Calycina marina]|uniref:Fungal-specific transcription factor domain-containing protein n=1 Tax=Calycina marina TaxID=1763456 RepID=A0A9P7Z0F7_9HELO|nr:fungal-specific transcription factor domain-containing protein [Calycina marina]